MTARLASELATDADLASELATPLSPQERAIGGSTYSRSGGPDLAAAMAVWDLLAYVMGEKFAPAPRQVVRWRAYDRAHARHWGERELARKVVGTSGCPSVTPPRVLERYVARWESEAGR